VTVAELARDHWPRLVRFAQTVTRDPDAAEDAVAAALVTAVRRSDASESETGIRWLYRVVFHEALHLAQSRQRETPIEQTFQIPAREEDHDALIDMRDAMPALKPDERIALLSQMLGYSYDEIGHANGWTYTKVNRCLTEGRRALRKAVAA
jgi:RNA polymerase sigma factor (sigma-70 family)